MGNQPAKFRNQGADSYDFVLDLPSIAQAKEGWPLLFSTDLLQSFHDSHPELFEAETKVPREALLERLSHHLCLNEHKPIVAFLGLYNRGKTFLVNLMAEANLPSSKKVHTKGLSFFIPTKNRNFTFLDTAGSNAPVSETSDDHLAQRKNTEQLLDDMVIAMADIVVIVVTEITWLDQQYIECIKAKLGPSQTLVVVHNFLEAGSELEVLEMWKKCVLQSNEGLIKSHLPSPSLPKTHYLLDSQNNLHFPLANGRTSFGRLFNHSIVLSLKHLFGALPKTANLAKRSRERRDEGGALLPLFCGVIEECLGAYCRKVERVEILFGPEWAERELVKVFKIADDSEEARKWGECSIKEGSCSLLKVVVSGDLSLRRDLISFEGNRIVVLDRENRFVPKFDQIELGGENGRLMFIGDLPGWFSSGDPTSDCSISCEVEEGPLGFLVIKGKRTLSHFNNPKEKLLLPYSSLGEGHSKAARERVEGEFERRLPFDQNRFEATPEAVIFEKGVLQIVLQRKKKMGVIDVEF